MAIGLNESRSSDPVWILSTLVSSNVVANTVPHGSRVAVEVIFDYASSEVSFTYDNDTSDDVDPLLFGPLDYEGVMQETHLMTIVSSSFESGYVDGVLDFLSVTPLSDVPGDFNGNGILDAADIDLLSEQVRAGSNDPLYDLNADTLVNDLDRKVWVHDLKGTFFGDTDLDGAFNSADLVQVLASGQYEDTIDLNSTWLTRDWDGDGDFTCGDLVVALADGGYEAGAAAVPEPAGVVLAMTAAALVAIRRRGCAKTRRA
jgi:hypothetical protein